MYIKNYIYIYIYIPNGDPTEWDSNEWRPNEWGPNEWGLHECGLIYSLHTKYSVSIHYRNRTIVFPDSRVCPNLSAEESLCPH